MGTTIRREPVNFDIPNAPDYKFLNITNFRGLDISSNPFELSPNTASDCLNVYVDETNTLTTRPRLEKKIATPIDGEHIGTYNLHNGYLLHYLVNGVGVMKTLIDSTLTDINGEEIPITKCQCFEHGDKIYLLDGNRYMVISENILNDVEGYIPTTAVVDINGNRKSVEGLNILSDKYIEEYHWDGISKPKYDAVDVIDVKNNNYVTRDNLYNSTDAPLYRHFVYVAYDDGLLASPKYSDNDDGLIYYFKTSDKFATVTKSSTGIDGVPLVCATKQKLFWYINDEKLLKFVYYNKDSENWIESSSSYDLSTVYSYKAVVSADGECLFFINYTNDTFTFFLRNTDDTFSTNAISTGDYDFTESSTPSGARNLTIKNFYITNTQPYTVAMSVEVYGASESPIIIVCDSVDKRMTKVASVPGTAWTFQGMTLDGSLMYFVLSGKLLTISNFDESTKTQYKGVFNSTFKISEDGQYAYMLQKKGSYYDINILPTYYDTNVIVPMNVSVCVTTTYDPTKYYNSIKEYMRVEPTKMIFSQYKQYGFYQTSGHGQLISVWNPDDLPKLTLTKRLNSQSPQYSILNDERKNFFKSNLYTRFNNNYWFANKNRYYRSQYNDPTYFPITEYNDLGDSNEEITGFNLANDSTLIAYKKNRLYLIQPFTSSLDTTEYTITESKNTVGNTAIGAPIVTTLTEIPLQINNDGIYGLSQLSNVSSTERVADLLSEPINERWLNIDDTLITNAQTLNRLYWTYIILPDADKIKTMIYLLDNRSNSWYYWELPIVVAESFVKDNRAEFVDATGAIYYLTTTDIIDKNYDDERVTKYYDDGNKLIPWFWQSQIMPMGTMNYSKRLVNTTFILTDTDDNDGYGLKYSFKVFRKLASSVPEKEITDKLTLVRSTTRKTNISKFGFLQMRLSNLTKESRDYEAYENNKLRLVGLGLKYVLLEGLIR